MEERKPISEVTKCAECDWLRYDKGKLRCMFYDGAIIEDASEKQCNDSVW